MNNDTDKLRAEMQAKMQTMTDELYSQLGLSESMLSEGSIVSAEIHYATDVMDARIHGFLAGQQYESDRHRDVRDNYAKLQDKPASHNPIVEKFDNRPAHWLSCGRDEKYNRYYKCSRCMHEIVIDTEFERYVGLPDTCEVCGATMRK